MPADIQEIYNHILGILPPVDRLRLATLILNDLVQQDIHSVDLRDIWTEQDQLDLVSFSLEYAVSEHFDDEGTAN